MSRLVVLVMARKGDTSVATLAAGSREVHFVIGETAEAVAHAASQAEAVFFRSGDAALLDRVLSMAPAVRWVHTAFSGVERILSPYFIAHSARLTNTRGVFGQALAEFALGSMLYFAKDFARMRRNQAAGVWAPFFVTMLQGKTLGLVGYGDIGQRVATLANGLGMSVNVLRRRPELSGNEAFIRIASSKRDLFRESDYLVLAAPDTTETRHLVGREELAWMKPSAVLVNVARGSLVDEVALVDALQRKALRGAALDVTAAEPLTHGHPFYERDDVLLCPHCADVTEQADFDILECFQRNLERFRVGEPLKHEVEKARGY